MSCDFTTLVDVLRRRAGERGAALGYTFLDDGEQEGAKLTYADLDRRARAIAVTLLDRGLARGDRVLLLFAPGLDFIPAFFGCLYAGVAAVPCYPPQPGQLSRILPRLLGIINDAQVSAVLSTSGVARGATAMTQHAGALRGVDWIATDSIDDDARARWSAPAIDGGSLAFLQYTSGSTAAPRGVMVTHDNLLHNLGYARFAGANDETTVSVSWLPVIHDMGLIEGVLQPVYAGYPAYLMAPASFLHRPVRWLRAISRYRATNSGGPNFSYDLCVRKVSDAHRAELDLSSWRVAYNGSEPIRAETLGAFHDRFRGVGFRWDAFRPAYGLAESTLLVSTAGRGHPAVVRQTDAAALSIGEMRPSSPANARRALVSSGTASFGTTVIVVDPETCEPCSGARVGEIWVSSPSVARGYWRRDEETRDTFEARLASGDGPFLRTGDLGVIRDGEIFITGRLKDLLIVRGMKHYPQDIELTAERQDPAIRAGCVAAFSVGDDGEESIAVAMEIDPRRLPDDGAERDASLARIIGAVRTAVVEHHGIVLSSVALLSLGAIPKTSSGKIRRRACRVEFEQRTLDEIVRWPAAGSDGAIVAPAARLLRTGS